MIGELFISSIPISRRLSLPTQLPQLTALLDLRLTYCVIPPTALASMTQLQRLDLAQCLVSPAGLSNDAAADSAGAATLLDLVPKLQHLQQLQLTVPRLCNVSTPFTAFSALTASSRLTELAMAAEGKPPLPADAVQRMFAPGKKLLQLKHVDISVRESAYINFCIDADGLAGIVTCYPALERLDIAGVVAPGVDYSVLLQLPASCSKLDVGGPSLTDSAAGVLAQLTDLRDLSLFESSAISNQGLATLTALQGLTRLNVVRC
jgi:hypothetical protein